MSNEIIGIIAATTASILIAIGAVSLKRSYQNVSEAVNFIIFSIFTAIIWSIPAVLYGIDLSKLDTALFYGAISALLAQGVYIFVLSKGELSITSSILSTYPIYTIIFSFIFLSESLNVSQILFVGLSLLGTIIVTIPKKISKSDIKNITYIYWPIIGAASIGLSDTISKNAISELDIGTFLFGMALAHLPIAIIYFLISKEKFQNFAEAITHPAKYLNMNIGALFTSTGTMFIFIAFEYIQASIASPISGTSPVIVLILSVYVLKEKLNLKDLTGIILAIIGVIGIGLAG